MKLGLIGYGKMNRLIEKASPFPIVCTTRDRIRDFSADLYIDFSHASLVEENALALAERDKTLLIGTTGWKSLKVVDAFKKRGSALFCPNFSNEVRRFVSAATKMCELLGAPTRACEWHHQSKRDAPSGTAKLIEAKTGTKFESMRLERTQFKHTLWWNEISLTHEAKDRTAYVQGALEAAKWLFGKRGWYEGFCWDIHAPDHSLCGK
ncbi:MAG: 4-hydroxy-tetrahydrodipicolinate reductase [Chlamydiales bacterium]|nr:4-hydroxy-tetrahydrodipicolinate reductase [Chlamydiales bacterium]MCH9635983.1 4-hydroxy-tetrahydrodipicolinate reductase [Chlamydiales bacterium]MCH9703892.1 hypothetical protein [Chlamydiota bacterium]